MRSRAIIAAALVFTFVAACSSGSASSRAGTKPKATTSVYDTAPPREGGVLTVGLDAETDGWNPVASQWSGPGYAVGAAIFDPLIAGGNDNKAHPYLAQSVTPDRSYMHWTIKLRPNIKFHDGERLNADALMLQFSKIKQSFVTSQLFGPMANVAKVDDLTIRVNMSQPWVAFPEALASQAGYIAAPKQLRASPEEAAKHPIGTGPYIFDSWQRDDHFTATKNPNYWQRGLPHPAKIVFRVIPDQQTRIAALQSGQIDYTYTGDASQILQFRGDKSVTLVEQPLDRPGFIMLNTAAAPLDDVRVRQALAYATDAPQILQTLGRNIGSVADGPYRPASPWYVPSGYPTAPNVARARGLLDDYKRSKGVTGNVKITVGCTPVGNNQQMVDLLKAQWAKAGIDVSEKMTEQATYINDTISGHYQANCWTQFGSPDPDIDTTWWISTNANPIGAVALNFTRLKDAQIDADLKQARENPDFKVRKAAYGRVWKRFAALVPYVWTTRGELAFLWNKRLHVVGIKLPDGADYAPPDKAGAAVPLAGVWVS